MSDDLHRLLHDLADEMTGTNYAELRERVDRTSHRIGRRHTMAGVASAFVVVAVAAGGGYALASHPTPGPGPNSTTAASPTATGPTATTSPGTTVAPPIAVPGTLVYVGVTLGQPIVVTTVIDGVVHESTFGPATESDTYLLPVPSPDASRLVGVESPDPGFVKPGKLVVISPGGARRVIATGVAWSGGHGPVWLPDGQHVIATVAGRSTVVDVATGQTTPAPSDENGRDYLTWSANGQWRAYGDGDGIVVAAVDGSGTVRRPVPPAECRQDIGCPTSVQAVSDDGRYVALGDHNTDPDHVYEAHLVLDMRTGALVDLPATVPGARVHQVFFRPDGAMIVRIGTSGGAETLLVLRPDGTTLAIFREPRVGNGGRLVAYHP